MNRVTAAFRFSRTSETQTPEGHRSKTCEVAWEGSVSIRDRLRSIVIPRRFQREQNPNNHVLPERLPIAVLAAEATPLVEADEVITSTGSTSVSPTLVTEPQILWPVNGSRVTGLHKMEAVLPSVPLSSYHAFWQLDNCQTLVPMDDDNDGGNPCAGHKSSANVDFTGWNWRDDGDSYGPFVLTFIFQDLHGTVIAHKSITVYVTK